MVHFGRRDFLMSGMIALLAGGLGAGASTPAEPPLGGLIVSTSPDYSYVVSTSAGVYTPAVTTYVGGGAGPYSYSWTVLSEAAGSLGIRNPSSRTTGFYFSTLEPVLGGSGAEFGDAVARVTVTDSLTGDTGYADVSVSYSKVP